MKKYVRRPTHVRQHTRRTTHGRVQVRSHYRNVNHRIRNRIVTPRLTIIREPKPHVNTDRLLNMLNVAFPHYSPLIEAGRIYLNNRKDIHGIISTTLKDIPIEDKMSYTLNKILQHRDIIIKGLTSSLFNMLCNIPSLKFLKNNAFNQILGSEMSEIVGSLLEG